jgi:uncharacterized cupin superfamily protein
MWLRSVGSPLHTPHTVVMTTSPPYPHLLRKADIEAKQTSFSHPWNPQSDIRGTWMGRLAGLTRTGVSLGRLAPGKESFAYHLHHREEEWVYVLSGRAVAQIDGQHYTLEPGDFVAFPTPSVAHNMANPFDEELVYLMGGENLAEEIADFPTLDRRMVKLPGELTIYKLSDGKPFFKPEA